MEPRRGKSAAVYRTSKKIPSGFSLLFPLAIFMHLMEFLFRF